MRIVPDRLPPPDRNIVIDPVARDRWFNAMPDECMACGRTPNITGIYGLQIHHLAGGSGGRSDEPCNLLKLCYDCHHEIHDHPASWPIFDLLRIKRYKDPEHDNAPRVIALKGWAEQ
jgi:hypothetical protein